MDSPGQLIESMTYIDRGVNKLAGRLYIVIKDSMDDMEKVYMELAILGHNGIDACMQRRVPQPIIHKMNIL